MDLANEPCGLSLYISYTDLANGSGKWIWQMDLADGPCGMTSWTGLLDGSHRQILQIDFSDRPCQPEAQ